MVKRPLTFGQAQRFTAGFQHLVGQRLHNIHGMDALVETVCVVPYDATNKYVFMREYKKFHDCIQALKTYDGDGYDVVIIGTAEGSKGQLVFRDLDSYLEENEIAFDLGKYR